MKPKTAQSVEVRWLRRREKENQVSEERNVEMSMGNENTKNNGNAQVSGGRVQVRYPKIIS